MCYRFPSFGQTAKLCLEQPITQLNILFARFHRTVVSSLRNVLQNCMPGASNLTATMRRNCLQMCLEGLFHFAEEYPQLDASKPFPSYFPSTFVVAIANMSLEFIHSIQTEKDPNFRVVWRCFCALVAIKLVDSVSSRTNSNVQINNDELACLSAILGIQSDDVRFCLECPGAVELSIIVPLAFGDVALCLNDSSEHVKSLADRTFAASFHRVFPAQTVAIAEGCTHRGIIVSRCYDLLQMCISDTSTLTANVRRSCLRMCLKSRWYCVKAYHQLDQRLPSYFLKDFACLETIRRIQTAPDLVSRVMGDFFRASVVMKLAADSYSTRDFYADQGSLEWLSSILDTKSNDVRFSLHSPGTVELAMLVRLTSDDVGSLDVKALPPYLLDMAQETLDVLSRQANLNLDQSVTKLNILDEAFGRMVASRLCDLLRRCVSDTSSFTFEVRKSCLRVCLNCRWYMAQTYHTLAASTPLPSYFLSILASPDMIHLIKTGVIKTGQDAEAGVTERCFGALVAVKLVADLRLHTDSNVQISSDELACLSAILDTDNHTLKIWLGQPGAVELASLISLTVGLIDTLYLFSDTPPSGMLDMVQQTSNILIRTLPVELNVELMDFTDGQCEVILLCFLPPRSPI